MSITKAQNEFQINNESTHNDFHEPNALENKNHQSTNGDNLADWPANEEILVPEQQQSNQKTCAQKLKQKLAYFWFQIFNYLQFDQVFTNQELQLLKKESCIIKTKYPNNYYQTYEERSKSFGVSVEEVTRMKMQEQQIKNKNFWSELKRFICCQGGNELDENDELLTTASESEYFYLTKGKNYYKENRQITEQAFVQKSYGKMTRQENFQKDQKFGNNTYYFDEQQQAKTNNNNPATIKSNKTRDQRSNKHIDMNNVKTINKKQSEQILHGALNKQNSQKIDKKTTNDGYRNEKNDSKMIKNLTQNQYKNQQSAEKLFLNGSNDTQKTNGNVQKIGQNSLNDEKSKNEVKNKQTEKIYIQKREQQDLKGQQNYPNNLNNFDKNAQNEETLPYQSNRNAKQQQWLNFDSQRTKDNKGNFKNNKDQVQTEKNESYQNKGRKGRKNNKQSPDHKFTPINISMESEPNKNYSQGNQVNQGNVGNERNLGNQGTNYQNNFQSINYDNSDVISVTHSQNIQNSNGKNKRIKTKNTKQEPFLDLKVVENLDDGSSQLQEEDEQTYSDRKNRSFSSQQLNKKPKKPFNSNNFEEVNDVIKQGQYEDENDRRKGFGTIEGGNTTSFMGDIDQSAQAGKRKRMRNKKFFNPRQEDEKADEVIIFNENEGEVETSTHENDSLNHSHTIDIGDLNSDRMSSSTNIKKRKKLRKLKELNVENDEHNVIVLEGDEMLDEKMNNDGSIEIGRNYSTINNVQHQNFSIPLKADKKRKKKARLREQMQRQQQRLDVVDLGEIN